MPKQQYLDQLARVIAKPTQAPPKLTGVTTAGGTDTATRQDRLPTPIGSVGQVLTVVDDGGDIVPAWADATGGTGTGRYRMYVLVSDGAGGFDFVDDGAGQPVESLEALE